MKSPEMLAGSLQPGPESKRGYAGAWSGNGWFAPATKNPKCELGSKHSFSCPPRRLRIRTPLFQSSLSSLSRQQKIVFACSWRAAPPFSFSPWVRPDASRAGRPRLRPLRGWQPDPVDSGMGAGRLRLTVLERKLEIRTLSSSPG